MTHDAPRVVKFKIIPRAKSLILRKKSASKQILKALILFAINGSWIKNDVFGP